MSGRISNADVIRAQEARIDSLTLMVEKLTTMHAETLSTIAAMIESRRTLPAETFTIKRAAVGEKVDVFETNLVRQEDETAEQMVTRGQALHERLCGRYPLSDGRTHVWPLDGGSDPDPAVKLATDLRDSVRKGGAK